MSLRISERSSEKRLSQNDRRLSNHSWPTRSASYSHPLIHITTDLHCCSSHRSLFKDPQHHADLLCRRLRFDLAKGAGHVVLACFVSQQNDCRGSVACDSSLKKTVKAHMVSAQSVADVADHPRTVFGFNPHV